MKTRNLLIVLILVVVGICSLVLWNALRIKHTYTVYINSEYGLCLLVDERYQVEVSPTALTYHAGKNTGTMNIAQSGLNKDAQKIDINGFKGSYRKQKNQRIYEYLLNDKFTLVDVFENAERGYVNLVPYKDECQAIIKKHPKTENIFTGVHL